MVVVVKVRVMFWVVLMVESGRGRVWSGLVGSGHGWGLVMVGVWSGWGLVVSGRFGVGVIRLGRLSGSGSLSLLSGSGS